MEWLTNLMSGGGAGVSAGGQGGFAGLGIGNPGSYGGQFSTTANVPAPASTGGGGVGGLLADPNFQNFLAGTGAALDPEGVGGALGKATQGMIQNKQMGKAMEKQDARWNALIEAMAGGKVGKATLKEDPKGGTTVTLGAPESGLGSLSQPSQSAQLAQPNFLDDFSSQFKNFFGELGIKF